MRKIWLAFMIIIILSLGSIGVCTLNVVPIMLSMILIACTMLCCILDLYFKVCRDMEELNVDG